MTARDLLEIAEKRPENLLLAGTDELLQVVRDGYNATGFRRASLAELAARWCLSLDGGLADALAPLFGESWRAFEDWYRIVHPWKRELPGIGTWKDPRGLEGFEPVLRRRLRRLFEADGFIPVCSSAGAWFIPFAFDDKADGAVWSDGTCIDVWREPVRAALEGTGRQGIRLQLRDGAELAEGVKGRSLMLPVFLAALRGREDGLPTYDVFRVFSTGAFDGDSRLDDVELAPKFDAMKKQFSAAALFAPDVSGFAGRKDRAFHALDAGLDREALLREVRDALERMPGYLCMTCAYALRRLPDMKVRVDRENHRRWREVADQLHSLGDVVSRERDPETWLEFQSMRATSLCHAGRTAESKTCAQAALAFARENGFAAKALRLQVTSAVNAQDLGEMDEFGVLADGLEHDLEAFDGPEKRDLLMRFHGTAAQANAFGALCGLDGFGEDAARAHAAKALQFAFALAKDAVPEERDGAEANVAKDLNYRHLIEALFAPGSPAEEAAWREARRQLNELSPPSAATNRLFQMRQKSLALFNAWRRTGALPDATRRQDVRVPADDAEGWLVAANRRHLGALAAAAGEREEAERCFREGNEALPLEACESPVLGSIRFSLLVQAALSLAEADPENRYAALAEETRAAFRESALFKLFHAERWMAALHSGREPRGLPAFYY